MITIIEQKTEGKVSPEVCEDGIEVNAHFVAVIDGSTSKARFRINPDMTNGRYCMLLIKKYISEMPQDINFDSFCKGVTGYVRNEYKASDCDFSLLERHPEERMAASVAVYSDYYKQVWMIGDCQCLANGRLYENPKPYEERLAAKRAEYLKHALENELSIEEVQISDPGRASIINELRATCKEQNVLFSVVDGFDIPREKTKVIDIDDSTSKIVLASDGYPFLKDTLEESENALAALLYDDPLCIDKFKATKGWMSGNSSFDDRSYVSFSIISRQPLLQ